MAVLHRAHKSGFCSALEQLSHSVALLLSLCRRRLNWGSAPHAHYAVHERSAAASPSLASGVSRHPSQASSRVGQRSCRRGSDGKTSGTASTDVTSSSPNSGLSLKLRLFRMDPKQLIFKKLLRGCEKKSAGLQKYGIQVCLCSQSSSRPRHGAAVRYGLQCNCVQHAHQADHGLLISNAIVAVWSSGPAFILAEG